MLSTSFWEDTKEFLLKLAVRFGLLLLAVFPIVLTVLLLVGKLNKGFFKDKAIRKHNWEMRQEHREIKADESERLEEIRKELIDTETKEVWNLWKSVFKQPLG